MQINPIMLRIVSQSISQQLATYMHANTNLAAAVATKKNLSQSQHRYKKFVVKDHYEFDQKVINSEKPVVVNFHAEWCDPCKILTPKLLELLEFSNEIDLAVIDVDNNSNLVETFEVKAVPAVLAFRNGVVVDKFIGLTDIDDIEILINKLKRKKQNSNIEEEKR